MLDGMIVKLKKKKIDLFKGINNNELELLQLAAEQLEDMQSSPEEKTFYKEVQTLIQAELNKPRAITPPQPPSIKKKSRTRRRSRSHSSSPSGSPTLRRRRLIGGTRRKRKHKSLKRKYIKH